MLNDLEVKWDDSLRFNYLMGALEHLDWLTDTVLAVQVFKCDPELTDAWAAAFDGSLGWAWAPIIRKLHFSGVVTLFLVSAIVAQQAAAFWSINSLRLNEDTEHMKAAAAMAADTACFSAVAAHFQKDFDKVAFASDLPIQIVGHPAVVMLLSQLSKVFLEKKIIPHADLLAVQLFTCFYVYGIMFHHISAEGIKILGGMILGLLSASNKIGGSIAKLVTHPQTDQHRWICACCTCCIYIIYILPCLVFLLWISLKLWYVHFCPSHKWNSSTGCVDSAPEVWLYSLVSAVARKEGYI